MNRSISCQITRNKATVLASLLIGASPAIAAPPSKQNCRAVINLLCSPDSCEVKPLAGGRQFPNDPDPYNWIAGTYGTTENRLSFNSAQKKLSICWERRCWTAQAAKVWKTASLIGASGQMVSQFYGRENTTFVLNILRVGSEVNFSLASYPTGESLLFYRVPVLINPREKCYGNKSWRYGH